MMMEHVLMLYDNHSDRKVYALDTFTGFVRRTEGLDVDIETGADACLPTENDDYTIGATDNMKSVGFRNLEIVKGDVF